MKKHLILYIFLSLFGHSSMYAQNPVPAKEQSKAIVLFGGTAHIGNGTVIENAMIGFENGILKFVVPGKLARIDVSDYEQIDVSGQHVYPGFILPNSQIGLQEISAVQATIDKSDVAQYSPNVRSQIAFNTDSKLIPTIRFNGILILECAPVGNRISGTSSVMNLDAWNWEDATLKKDIGVHLNWPSSISYVFDESSWSYKKDKNPKYKNSLNELNDFFDEALSYYQSDSPPINLKYEAMKGLFSDEKILFIHADGTKEIIESVRFAQGFGIKRIVIETGTASIDAAPFLAENNIPVVLQKLHSLPDNDDMEYDLPYRMAHILNDAGVSVSLGYKSFSSTRNLPFLAGTAVAYGVDYEEAVQMISLNTAKILGIDKEVGSIEEGKRATLFVSKGDALDMKGNSLTYAFIDGKQIDLNGEQQILYERYRKKYIEEGAEKNIE